MESRRDAEGLEDLFADPAPIERALGHLVHLHAVSCALGTVRTVSEVVDALFTRALPHLGAHGLYFVLLDDTGRGLAHARAVGYGPEIDREARDVRYDADLPVTCAARTGESFFLESPDALLDRFPGSRPHMERLSDRAIAAVPLRDEQRVRGAFGVTFGAAHFFDAHERRFLVSVAGLVGQTLGRLRADEAERRARAEAERALAGHARAEALLATLVDSAPAGVAFLDRELRWRRVNPRLADIHGWAAEDHLGRRFSEVVPRLDDVPVLEARLHEVLETGVPLVDLEVAGETAAAPGRRRHWRASFYPVEVDHEVIGLGALVREVTVEMGAEAFRRRVLGVVGHDLRTPLSAIRMGVETLREVVPPEAGAESVLLGLERSARRMADLIEDLLDYERFTAGAGVRLRRSPVDLEPLCRQVLAEIRAGHRDRTIAYFGEGPCEGQWDAGRLSQVLTNLVVNALCHGARDRPVTVTLRRDADGAHLSVCNEGPAIPEALRTRIFEPFERSGGSAGHGLGLFIVRELVRAHGGRVEVRSTEADGTRFEVVLPFG